MKRFIALFVSVIIMIVGIFVSANIYMGSANVNSENNRIYRVEANRIANEISQYGVDKIKLEDYPHIKAVVAFDDNNSSSFYKSDYDYLVKEIDGNLYRIDYTPEYDNSSVVAAMNISLLIMSILLIAVFVYVMVCIIRPFNVISSLPYELSRGNLTPSVKEQKGKYFGKFIWGIDLLRENLQEQKERELALQKDKKTLVLSISHDIKTPLGVIELYAKALEKNLYQDEEKRRNATFGIIEKCGEINSYISDIIRASSEDFLNLEVKEGEFYLSQMMKSIGGLYKEKAELLQINFIIEKYTDCVISGDLDRSVEVLQNVLENAIKYGDGKEISLSFKQEEDCMLVTVSNSGCILSEKELSHIFESFWRGSNVGTNSGSGLGLYICRQLMRKMNGEIFAQIRNGNMLVTAVFPMA